MDRGTSSFNGAAKEAPAGRSEVYDALGLLSIHPDGRPEHIASLVGHDDVHGVGVESIENLRKYRLGGPQTNRSCWAVRNADNELQSAIYLHREYNRIASPRNLAGNVRDILASEVVQKADVASSVIFYSITRIGPVRGAGEVLIAKLHEKLNQMYINSPMTKFSTLSPLRQPGPGKDGAPQSGIDDFITESGYDWHKLSDAAKRALVLMFLMQKKEPVQRFHMGNGAIIGDIKLDADRIESGKHRVMVNYIYDRDPNVLKSNSAKFRNAQPGEDILALVSPELLQETQGALHERRSRFHFLSGILPALHAPFIK